MIYSDQDLEAGINALGDGAQNRAYEVRYIFEMFRANMAGLVVPNGAKFRFGSGPPSVALGNAGDVYDNILTADRYQKLSDGTWGFQYNAKGKDGRSPQKGVDYSDGYTPRKGTDYRDGIDGKSAYQIWLDAGNTGTPAAFLASLKGAPATASTVPGGGSYWHQESYDPASTDGKDGEYWETSVTLATCRRFKKVAGTWRKFFDNTGVAVVTPPANALPTVSLASSGSPYQVGKAITFTPTAADSDGTPVKVDLYNAFTNELLKTSASAPFLLSYTPTAAGDFSFYAKATDDKSGISQPSNVVQLTVGAAVRTAPAITGFSPASGAAGATVVLTGTGFIGVTLVSLNSGAVASFAVDSDTQITAVLSSSNGTGKFSATHPQNGTGISTNNFTVANPTPAPQDITITPVAADWQRNTITGAFGSTTGQRSPLARLFISTDATSVVSSQRSLSNSDRGAPMRAVGFQNGGNLTLAASTLIDGTPEDITAALPGSGQRIIQITEGPTLEVSSTTRSVGGTQLSKLVFKGATNATIVSQPTPGSAMVWVADSIGSGFSPTSPHTEAVSVQLESLLGYPVSVDGWGSRSIGTSLYTSDAQDIQVSRIAAVLNRPGTSLKQVWVALGINDYFGFGGGSTAAGVRTAVVSFMQKLQASIPGVKIYLETPKYTPVTYSATESIQAYRTAFAGAANDVPGVIGVDGLSMYDNNTSVLSSDSVHPNTLGMTQYAQRAYSVINAVAQPYVLGSKFLRIDESENFSYSEFTASLSFDANAQAANSNGQLVAQAYNAPGTSYTVGCFGVYVNGGQIRAFLQDGTQNPTPQADVLALNFPTSGRINMIYSGGAAGQQLRVNGAVLNGPGRGLASHAGIKMAIGATPTAPTGSGSQGDVLNCAITNFSFFKRILTDAEKGSIIGGNGLLPPALAASADLLTYSRLIPATATAAEMIDAVTGTYRYKVLQGATSAPQPGMATAVNFSGPGQPTAASSYTRTAAGDGAWANGKATGDKMIVYKGSAGLQGTVRLSASGQANHSSLVGTSDTKGVGAEQFPFAIYRAGANYAAFEATGGAGGAFQPVNSQPITGNLSDTFYIEYWDNKVVFYKTGNSTPIFTQNGAVTYPQYILGFGYESGTVIQSVTVEGSYATAS